MDDHRHGGPGRHRRGVHRALRHQQFEQQQRAGDYDDDGPAHRPGYPAAGHHEPAHHLRDHNGAADDGHADDDRGTDNDHHRRFDDLSGLY
jgi:hypothetical protein